MNVIVHEHPGKDLRPGGVQSRLSWHSSILSRCDANSMQIYLWMFWTTSPSTVPFYFFQRTQCFLESLPGGCGGEKGAARSIMWLRLPGASSLGFPSVVNLIKPKNTGFRVKPGMTNKGNRFLNHYPRLAGHYQKRMDSSTYWNSLAKPT